MKLSSLNTCDSCHGVLAPQGMFYVIRVSLALLSVQALQQVTGLATMFNGALGLSEVMAPDAEVIKIAGDEDPELMSEFLVCQKCYLYGKIDLAVMAEAKNNQ